MAGKIAITGASGFIGSHFRKYFESLDCEVVALSRSSGYQLGKPLPEGILREVDVALHCAHEMHPGEDAFAKNLEGAKILIQEVRAAGVRRLVFLSSLTVETQSSSIYGKSKRAIEELLDPARDLILRPGLVLGRGGLFGRLVRFVQISPIVPLVGGGDFPVRTVHISDLIKVTSRLLSENRTGVFTIAEPPGPTLGDLLQCLARVTHKKRLFVSIPTSVVERTLALADKMKLRLPVTRENLLGLASLAPQAPLPMEDFGLRNYEASLKDLFGSQ